MNIFKVYKEGCKIRKVEDFPKNEYCEMLKQAPRQMVRLMLDQPAIS